MDWSPFVAVAEVASGATVLSILIGLPVAYALARGRIPGRIWLDVWLNLPLVLPPTVLGYGLLVALGRRTANWPDFYETLTGQSLVFYVQGAVVAACVASSASLYRHARWRLRGWIRMLSRRRHGWGGAARPASADFLLPLCATGISRGNDSCLARALGDFGATLMVAATRRAHADHAAAIYDAVFSGEPEIVRTFVILATASVSACASWRRGWRRRGRKR